MNKVGRSFPILKTPRASKQTHVHSASMHGLECGIQNKKCTRHTSNRSSKKKSGKFKDKYIQPYQVHVRYTLRLSHNSINYWLSSLRTLSCTINKWQLQILSPLSFTFLIVLVSTTTTPASRTCNLIKPFIPNLSFNFYQWLLTQGDGPVTIWRLSKGAHNFHPLAVLLLHFPFYYS